VPRVSNLRSDSPLNLMSVDVPYSVHFGYPCWACVFLAGGPASSSRGEGSLWSLPRRGGDDVHCRVCVRPGPCPSNDMYVLCVPSLDHQSEHVPSSVFSSHGAVGCSLSAPVLAIAAHERWPNVRTFARHLALQFDKSGPLVLRGTKYSQLALASRSVFPVCRCSPRHRPALARTFEHLCDGPT